MLLSLAFAAPAAAVAPANDTVAGAFTISDGPYPASGTLVSDITDATTTGDPPTPSCQTNVSRSVWYKWTPGSTAKYSISDAVDQGAGSTVDDTVLAVYTSTGGDAGPFTEVPTAAGPPATDGCDDDSATTEGLQSTLAGTFTGGRTYYIVIWKFDTPAPTAGNTAVQPVIDKFPPSQADTFADALPLALDHPVDVNDTSDENDYQLAPASPCFGPGSTATTAPGIDSVYKFTAPSTDNYSFMVRLINTGFTATQNFVAYLAPAPPPPGPSPATVACTSAFNRQASTGGEMPSDVPLNAGQTVYIVVDRATAGFGAVLHLEAMRTRRETEPNNTPAQAIPRACGIHGAINPATEADFWSLGTPATGSRIFAMVDTGGAGTSADVDLRVNTDTDTLEFDDLDTDSPFGVSGFAPIISGFSATGVPLYLQVDRFGSAPTGVADPYLLYSLVQPGSGSATPESEPNNALSSATAAGNNYFSGALSGTSPSTDTDVYRFDVDAGTLIFAGLDGDPARNNTPVDTKLELIDPSGHVMLPVNGSGGTNTLDNGNPPGLFESQPAFVSEGMVWRPAQSGAYYLRVSAGSTSATTAAGDYLLSVSLECQQGAGPVITTGSLPDGTRGLPYNQTLNSANASGSPHFELASGHLPDGLGLTNEGTILGTPTSAGDSNFAVRVTDSRNLTYTRDLKIKVKNTGAAQGDTTSPTLSKAKLSNKKFAPVGAPKGKSKRGTSFSFELSEAARVSISIAQRTQGRRVKKKCVKPTKKNRKAKRCTLAVKKGALSSNGKAGKNTVKFSGKLKGRKLKPGAYEATLVATDAAGNKSKAVKLRFKVVRR